MEKFNPRKAEFEALRAAAAGNPEPARKLFKPERVVRPFTPWMSVPSPRGTIQRGNTWVGRTGEALEQKEKEEEEQSERRKGQKGLERKSTKQTE